jgi:hypothetical protein
LDKKREEFDFFSNALDQTVALGRYKDAADIKGKLDELSVEDNVGQAYQVIYFPAVGARLDHSCWVCMLLAQAGGGRVAIPYAWGE